MKKRVFVVDDEPIIADTLTAILNMNGYDASPFYDGRVVLAACERDVPECVISDVMMPAMTGVDLAIRLRQQIPQCRILLFSGQAATFDMLEEARRAGHDFELLSKPVHPKDLLARLNSDGPPVACDFLPPGRNLPRASPATINRPESTQRAG